MKLKLTFVFVFIYYLFSTPIYSQKVVLKITDSYFRHNPFNQDFKSFLTHLVNDTLLAYKQVKKKTDSTLFFFKGRYKKYNSFDLNPSLVEVRLAESGIELQQGAVQDTIMLYQILIYTSRKNKSISNVEKEFKHFHRKFKSGFTSYENKDLVENNKPAGMIMNYFFDFSPIPMVTAAYTNGETDENIFAITLRMKVIANRALLPSVIDEN